MPVLIASTSVAADLAAMIEAETKDFFKMEAHWEKAALSLPDLGPPLPAADGIVMASALL